jgi:xanthine dehydrogenase accessory factor
MVSEAILLTPGGGKIGSLVGGGFDGQLSEEAARKLSIGRIIELDVSPFDSTITGIPTGTNLRFALIPASLLEPEIWPALLAREAIAIVAQVAHNEIIHTEFFTSSTIVAAESDVIEIFHGGVSKVVDLGDRIVTVYIPVTRLVIAGTGPIAEALAAFATQLGWKSSIEPRPGMLAGLTASLSPIDAVVVMGHDVESSSQCLAYALESTAGYIGALGSKKMQENREDWLAYRDITDISRVHGPAGFNISASTPAEIAVSIVAEVIATLNSQRPVGKS